jgi:hypothetical protein
VGTSDTGMRFNHLSEFANSDSFDLDGAWDGSLMGSCAAYSAGARRSSRASSWTPVGPVYELLHAGSIGIGKLKLEVHTVTQKCISTCSNRVKIIFPNQLLCKYCGISQSTLLQGMSGHQLYQSVHRILCCCVS